MPQSGRIEAEPVFPDPVPSIFMQHPGSLPIVRKGCRQCSPRVARHDRETK